MQTSRKHSYIENIVENVVESTSVEKLDTKWCRIGNF